MASLEEILMPLTEKELGYRSNPNQLGERIRHGSDEAYLGEDGTARLPLEAALAHGVMPGTEGGTGARLVAFNRQARFVDVPAHRHDYVELCYVFRGSCTDRIEGRPVRLEQGDVRIMDTGLVHYVQPLGERDLVLNCCMSRQYFTAGLIERLSAHGPVARFLVNTMDERRSHNHSLVIHAGGSPTFEHYFERAFLEFSEPGVCSSGALDSLINLLFIELVRCYKEQQESLASDEGKGYITEVLDYMQGHCAACTLDEVAARFGYHPNYLSRQLKAATGAGFKELVTGYRLERAALALLVTDAPVSSVAQECGYGNLTYFYKKFAERYGCTPGEYRERAHAG